MSMSKNYHRSEAETAWDSEIENRVAQIEAGTVTLLTHEQFISVFGEARAELSERKNNRMTASSPRNRN